MKIKQNLYPQDPLVNARVEARKSSLAKDASAVSVRLIKAGVVQMENRPGDIAQKDKNLERMLAFAVSLAAAGRLHSILAALGGLAQQPVACEKAERAVSEKSLADSHIA